MTWCLIDPTTRIGILTSHHDLRRLQRGSEMRRRSFVVLPSDMWSGFAQCRSAIRSDPELAGFSSALPLSAPPPVPPSTPSADLSVTDPGLILVVVVIPVVLVALIWLGYIFWLIFHEGENIGSGSPPPRVNQAERPSDRRQEPPERPGSVG